MKSFELPLTVNHRGMTVPYHRPDDPNSHDFVDLKANPEKTDLLPELRDWPELKATIKTIIGLKGFQTLGCGNWQELDANSQMISSSYVQLCFVHPELRNHVETYYSLYHYLGIRLYDATLPDVLRIEAQIKRTGFNGGKLAVGWSMDYKVYEII